MRVGQGFDVHALVQDAKLVIGGVTIPFEKGCRATRRGCAAARHHRRRVGAAGLAISTPFSRQRYALQGCRQPLVDARAATRVRAAGFKVVNVDSTSSRNRPGWRST